MRSDLLKNYRHLFSVVSKDPSILRHSIYASIPFVDGRLPVVIQVRESRITSVAGSGKAMRDVRLAIMMPTFLNRRSRFLAVAGQRDTNILPPSHNKAVGSLGKICR